MLKYLVPLEWKAFSRAASFKFNLFVKILFLLGALYLLGVFMAVGVLSYFLLEENGLPPFETINKYLIYYFAADLSLRFFFQKLPTANIRPLLILNIKRSRLVKYFLEKTIVAVFNTVHLFFFIPLCGIMIYEGMPVVHVVFWGLSLLLWIYCFNFLNLLINNRPVFFYVTVGIIAVIGVLHYFEVADLTIFTELFFKSFYDYPFLVVVPLGLLVLLYKWAFSFYSKNLYLDSALSKAQEEVETEDFSWLDRFGTISPFLKNDLRMIKRNKRPRTTVVMSLVFLLFGLLSFGDIMPEYNNDFMHVAFGIMITGGFLLNFGQFVPSWDSSYYPLMMCQNIKYRDYLMAKWWLMVLGTLVSMVLSSFYLFFGWEVYALILAIGVFNIGVNGYLVLWGGAYIKTPVDLEKNKNVFGEKQAFNLKAMLVSMPKVFVPIMIYIGFKTFWNLEAALIALTVIGASGLVFRNRVFDIIERLYKSEKYEALKAYKQKN
ncbi:DUF5687 family protein [Flavobacterium sp. NKUCC04_CG]|uniref:DUF5687 family protein n=1 Tax=Flavobacterium sp. NKUCC04_CG TaxID=2842121 RepID=UPI001C5BCD7E|nr:DUF5687 family protein [Flavobacterium sp. NKUCC04_CG]MBW3518788.1 hypothetical protein [Flavobacterium sp. NKUCC04_CG]